MNETLTHELVHSYDYCRAELDWNDLQHLACTEVGTLHMWLGPSCYVEGPILFSQIRAANLSGECFFWKETFARLKFGWRKHHQV